MAYVGRGVESVMSKLTGKDFGEIELYGPTGDLVKVRPADDVSISPDLNEEMRTQPALFAFYAAAAERAHAKAKRVKFKIHCLREDLDADIRKREADLPKAKRSTETAIKTEINRDPSMRKLYEKYVEAQRVSGYLYALKESFQQRVLMLQSIGANLRGEVGGELRTLVRKTDEATRGLRNQKPTKRAQ